MAFDLGTGCDPAGEYNGEGASFDIGNNIYEIRTSELIDMLTFGEILELISAFKTKSFFTFLKKIISLEILIMELALFF